MKHNMYCRSFLFLIISFLIICPIYAHSKTSGERLSLEPTRFNKLKGWADEDHSDAVASFRESCKVLDNMPVDKQLGFPGRMVGDWRNVCKLALKVNGKAEAKKFFETNFVPYKGKNRGSSEALLTGYYVPELKGSVKKNEKYKYPLYKLPGDLKKDCSLKRADINAGALEGKGLELVYLDDPIELFFLHIQGSGRIRMENGSVMNVGFAGKNGCKYMAVGKYLMNKGEIGKGQATVPMIKKWLRNHPNQINEVLNQNESYIFFRESDGNGVIGAQGVPLTPEHSLAVDNNYVPYSIPIWVQTSLPDMVEGSKKYRKLMIAQDAGSGISGPLRGDIFFGSGKDAEEIAGSMKQSGEFYFLIPKNIKIY